jgi:hypothetical protein
VTEQGLFGDIIASDFTPRDLKKNEAMRFHYGKRDDKKCGDCGYLLETSWERGPTSYFKCEKFGISASAATDWRKKYLACGLWVQGNGRQDTAG